MQQAVRCQIFIMDFVTNQCVAEYNPIMAQGMEIRCGPERF